MGKSGLQAEQAPGLAAQLTVQHPCAPASLPWDDRRDRTGSRTVAAPDEMLG